LRGCICHWVSTLPRRWTYKAAGGILVVLVVLLVGLPSLPVAAGRRAVWLTDGICHLLAFCLGFGVHQWWQRRHSVNRGPSGDRREVD
jgi:hypothetical protein